MINHKESTDLLQGDWLNYVNNHLGVEPWITVYHRDQVDALNFALFYCGLIPNSKVPEVLTNSAWNLRIAEAKPGCFLEYKDGKEIVTYHRFGEVKYVEPLVIYRDFHDIKKKQLEISEEFRLFHNLFHDTLNNKYIKIDECGDEEIVAICEDELVSIKLEPLQQFLGIKEMHLAVFFSINRYSESTLEELGLEKSTIKVQQDALVYDFSVAIPRILPGEEIHNFQSFSRFAGKKLIPGTTKEKSGIWPYQEEKQYQEFLIGFDRLGDKVFYTSNPAMLSNIFKIFTNAPFYDSSVFFKRDVLERYLSNPEKYSIDENFVRCRDLWSLQINNTNENYVVASLGDLGQYLPYKEQLHWKMFNIPPEDADREANLRRKSIPGWIDVDADEDELMFFKDTYKKVQNSWEKKFGWSLFCPLDEEGERDFEGIKMLVTGKQDEFDRQVQKVEKILIKSLNENSILSQLAEQQPDKTGVIAHLTGFLKVNGLADFEPHVDFLRSLSYLNAEKDCSQDVLLQRGIDYFKINERSLAVVFEDILRKATNFLKYLDRHFFEHSSGKG